MMAALTTSGFLLWLTFVLLNLLSISMSCSLSRPSYLCSSLYSGISDDVVRLGSHYPGLLVNRRAQEKYDDKVKRLLGQDRLSESASSKIEVAADWSGTVHGQPGPGTRNEAPFEPMDLDERIERMEDPRQRRMDPGESSLLDPTYLQIGIGRRRR